MPNKDMKFTGRNFIYIQPKGQVSKRQVVISNAPAVIADFDANDKLIGFEIIGDIRVLSFVRQSKHEINPGGRRKVS